jgi:hypothetical protein
MLSPKDLLARFERRLAGLQGVGPGFEAMLRYYEEERVDGCALDADGDMLLLQWGTNAWGGPERFELDLTRQIIWDDRGWISRALNGFRCDDPAIWQLSLTYQFPPVESLRGLGRGTHWCRNPASLESFRLLLRESAPVRIVAERLDGKRLLSFASAE